MTKSIMVPSPLSDERPNKKNQNLGVAEWCDVIDQIVSDFLAGDPQVAGSGRSGRGIVPVVDAGWRNRIPSHRGFVLADG